MPVSVICKPLSQRMASTVRHNRARGSHKVDLMSNIIKELHDIGRSDAWISKHLGMDRDEILRLKKITGLRIKTFVTRLPHGKCLSWKRSVKYNRFEQIILIHCVKNKSA